MIGWKVDQPSNRGNCTLRIYDGPSDSHFQTLIPLDGSADDSGSFACGRIDSSFEAKEVRFPLTVSCDSCILQLEWKTERGKLNYCADLEINGAEITECFGKCLNGGICSNGGCSCPENFEGSNC